MICPFCGKENSEDSKKCRYCGYQLSTSIDFDAYEKDADLQINVEAFNNKLESSAKKIKQDSYKGRSAGLVGVERSEEDLVEEENIQPERKSNPVEILILIALLTFIVSYVAYIVLKYGIDEIATNIGVMAVLGITGLVASIFYAVFEGEFPGTMKGLALRTIGLFFACEMEGVIGWVLFSVIFGISYVYISLTSRKSAVAIILGIISVTFLPFMGVAVILIISYMMTAGRTTNRKKKK